jgi:hypothetical protein
MTALAQRMKALNNNGNIKSLPAFASLRRYSLYEREKTAGA